MLESADVAFGAAALLEKGTNNHADFWVDVVQMYKRS
jgi:hypothetical protein